mmetsp:Transcript_28444/g.73060  ORF Transcript_28444/g.73060 Transcript_28444/m.73060 type:complete len:279 (-) Transcript_28444:132-968(-)
MELQRINTRGALLANGFRAQFGDYELRAKYRELFSKRTKPIHVMLVVDSSGSMRGEPTRAVVAAIESIAAWLGHFADSMSLWTFNDKILHKMRPTNIGNVDMSRLRRDLVKHVQGLTRLNDALYTVSKGWDTSKFYQCAKFMVFLTDGGENNSKFSVNQVQRELQKLSNTFDKFIFLTAGCDNSDISYLRTLLSDVEARKFTIKSASSNRADDIKMLFGYAQAAIEEIVVKYYYKGNEVAASKFTAVGGNQKETLAKAALADINHRMKNQFKVSLTFY